MSWDLFIFANDPRPFNDETKLSPLGDAAEVRTKISQSVPKVDWTDPAWGVLEGHRWSIEFNHKTNGLTEYVTLHVRGGGDPLTTIVKLCKDNGWVVFDPAANDLIDLAAPSTKSWQEFQGYRDQVIGKMEQAPSKSNLIRQYPIGSMGIAVITLILIVWVFRKNKPKAER